MIKALVSAICAAGLVATGAPASAEPPPPFSLIGLGVDGSVAASEDVAAGDLSGTELGRRAVAISTSPLGGYWIVTSDGIVSAFGGAHLAGDLAGLSLRGVIVAAASSVSGEGYLLVGADGGVFAFGDAAFAGSAASLELAAPIVDLAFTSSGLGYWLVAADGGVFAFGDARFHGSVPGALPSGVSLVAPIVSISAAPDDGGYLLAAADGGVFVFGNVAFFGSSVPRLQLMDGRLVGVFHVSESAYLTVDSLGYIDGFGWLIGNMGPGFSTIDVDVVKFVPDPL